MRTTKQFLLLLLTIFSLSFQASNGAIAARRARLAMAQQRITALLQIGDLTEGHRTTLTQARAGGDPDVLERTIATVEGERARALRELAARQQLEDAERIEIERATGEFNARLATLRRNSIETTEYVRQINGHPRQDFVPHMRFAQLQNNQQALIESIQRLEHLIETAGQNNHPGAFEAARQNVRDANLAAIEAEFSWAEIQRLNREITDQLAAGPAFILPALPTLIPPALPEAERIRHEQEEGERVRHEREEADRVEAERAERENIALQINALEAQLAGLRGRSDQTAEIIRIITGHEQWAHAPENELHLLQVNQRTLTDSIGTLRAHIQSARENNQPGRFANARQNILDATASADDADMAWAEIQRLNGVVTNALAAAQREAEAERVRLAAIDAERVRREADVERVRLAAVEADRAHREEAGRVQREREEVERAAAQRNAERLRLAAAARPPAVEVIAPHVEGAEAERAAEAEREHLEQQIRDLEAPGIIVGPPFLVDVFWRNSVRAQLDPLLPAILVVPWGRRSDEFMLEQLQTMRETIARLRNQLRATEQNAQQRKIERLADLRIQLATL